MIERINVHMQPEERYGHEFRYRLAAGWIDCTDVVLDAGCGDGYGAQWMQPCEYVGVDIVDVVEDHFRHHGRWIINDLCGWRPDFDFDVAVCFELLEHVTEPDDVIEMLCRARRTVVCSVPIVPTAGENPFHRWDFDEWDLPPKFAAHGFTVEQYVLQPTELSGVYVFRR